MKKYLAVIDEYDNDYRAFCKSIDMPVNSWDEAEEWARGETWSGHSYYVCMLIDRQTKKCYRTKRSFIDGVS